MPGFDGTGPLGKGPLTGRGEGFCVVPINNYNNSILNKANGMKDRKVNSFYPNLKDHNNFYNSLYQYFFYKPKYFKYIFRTRIFFVPVFVNHIVRRYFRIYEGAFRYKGRNKISNYNS